METTNPPSGPQSGPPPGRIPGPTTVAVTAPVVERGSSPLKKILLAQESGLILVIALLMALLTIFGGNKVQTDRVQLDAKAAVVVRATSADSEAIEVTEGAATKRYTSADGYTYRGNGVGGQLIQVRNVNRFLNFENLVLQLVYASFIAVMAVGMTAIIVMSGIDLSVGSIYAIAALCAAIALHTLQGYSLGLPMSAALGSAFGEINTVHKIPGTDELIKVSSSGGAGLLSSLPLCLLVCCVVGAACGLLNGAMIVGLRVHPFIITLGTMAAFRGAVAIPTKAQSVGNFPEAMTKGFFKMSVAGMNPIPPIIMMITAFGGAFLLSRTVLGRRVYAIGGNEVAARYAGIPVGRVKIIVYTIMGALAGLSAAMYLGYYGAAETAAGSGYELKVIAATVIGGASLSGGRGTALGAVLGAILVQLIENGMIILEVNQNYNQIVMGGAIILAVVLDQLKARLMPRGH